MLKSLEHRTDDLIHAIQEDAKSEIDKIRSQTKARESEILEAGKMEAEKIRAEILQDAVIKAAALRDEKAAELAAKNKMSWIERREHLILEVFTEARARFTDLIDTAQYLQALLRLVEEAIVNLQANRVVLQFDPKSRSMITPKNIEDLSTRLKVQIEVGEDLTSGLGIIAKDRSGHLIFDNTLESRLERSLDSLREPVFKILSGEKL